MEERIVRLNSVTLPDGLSVSYNKDKEFLILDFLSRKSLSRNKEDSKIESVFSVALSKEHISSIKEAIQHFEKLHVEDDEKDNE